MMDALQSLAALLASDPLTVAQVAARLGAVVTDYGSNVVVAPTDPVFAEANIARQVDRKTLDPVETPAFVILTPAAPVPLAGLTAAFGPSQEVPGPGDDPPELIFYLPMPGQPCAVALIARVRHDAAVRLTLRRDVRLPQS